MNSARHAVFIEPQGDLREMVVAWKARVAGRWPSAAYLSHPPHSTVWVGDVVGGGGIEHALVVAASRVPAFTLAIRSPHVFFDDALAGGGQTCAFAAVLTDDLLGLQQAVVEAVRAHRTPGSADFPFAGAHWIPHFTVASLPVGREDPVIEQFLGTRVSCEMPVRQLSWWRVLGERHERLASLPLAPPVS